MRPLPASRACEQAARLARLPALLRCAGAHVAVGVVRKSPADMASVDISNVDVSMTHANVHKCGEENPSHSMKSEDCSPSVFINAPKQMACDELKKYPMKCLQCSEIGGSCEQTKIGSLNLKKNQCISLEQSALDVSEHGLRNLMEGSAAEAVLQKEESSRKRVEDCTLSATSQVEKTDMNLVSGCDIGWEDLHLGEQVGQGSYAVVYHGIWNGSDVAIKVYVGNDYQEDLVLDYKKEISIMKRLRHPNVLLFMGAVYSHDRLAIVTEFLPRGSLFRTLHRSNQKLDLKCRLRMALDIARGMNYLHRRSPPIIHRDLKSSNILVGKNWTVKVGDFGLSCLKTSTVLTATSGKGTPQWMAPEALRGECTNEKSDVFSFGVILWELMTESVPWSQLSPLQVIGVVGFMDRRLDLPPNIDPRVSAVICNCWDSDPEKRPSFQELLGRMAELLGVVSATVPHRRLGHQRRGSIAVDDKQGI